MDSEKDRKKEKSAAQVLLSGISEKISAAAKLGLFGSRRKVTNQAKEDRSRRKGRFED